MGCISSKEIARSMSIREELNHGFQSKAAAWEELLASHTANDHLFAFVSSDKTKTNSTKLRSSNLKLPSRHHKTSPETNTYLANVMDLIPDINTTKTEAEIPAKEHDFARFTRSKSCQMASKTDGGELGENKLDWGDKNLRGSRSFHTVEEYDALLEKIHKFSTISMDSFEDCNYSWEDVKLKKSISLTEENGEEYPKLEPDNNEDLNSEDCENLDQENGARETGWKRKAVAKGLKSLDVSTAIEFPAIARFRQRIQVEDQVYSPGTYVTPKFGCYNAKVNRAIQEGEGSEGSSVFSPELVAAFEDCVQQLQEEEDSIIRLMGGYSPG